ncbi:MAG: TetR/AcrR family transcriptional regulator [Sphaerobacteraceae bacterium]|nr:MAG: TetR/AcrR family transcriptional regulator [Sphaerobacteraceae bacterium]
MSGQHNIANGENAQDEQSTREAILHAATVLFGQHGFRGASIRQIAQEAGVSAGLVQHHFGTKDGLREACDERVMRLLRDTQMQILNRGAPPIQEEDIKHLELLQPVIDYLILSLSSGTESSRRWFQEVSEYTHEALTSGVIGPPLDPETDDSRMIAAVQTAMALGVTAFYRTIQQSLEIDDESELLTRVGRARLMLAPERILGPEVRSQIIQLLDQYEVEQHQKTTGKPPPAESGEDTN